jgi:hypothetical protein
MTQDIAPGRAARTESPYEVIETSRIHQVTSTEGARPGLPDDRMWVRALAS